MRLSCIPFVVIFAAGCRPAADNRALEKHSASLAGLEEAKRDVEILGSALREKSAEELILTFIPTKSPKQYGGYEYYYNYMANDAIRDELERRGESARSALLAHRDDSTLIWEAINGPGESIGEICKKKLVTIAR